MTKPRPILLIFVPIGLLIVWWAGNHMRGDQSLIVALGMLLTMGGFILGLGVWLAGGVMATIFMVWFVAMQMPERLGFWHLVLFKRHVGDHNFEPVLKGALLFGGAMAVMLLAYFVFLKPSSNEHS